MKQSRYMLLACLSLFLAPGCQITSGQVETQRYVCSDILKDSDYRGDKPTWNEFGTITRIEKCPSGRYTKYKFILTNGSVATQQAPGDELGFYEISEQNFREMLGQSGFINNQEKIKNIELNGKPLFYALTRILNKPTILFAMSDGYKTPQMPPLWSMSHAGQLAGDTSMSLNSFENLFLDKIRKLRSDGGNYSTAYKGRSSETESYVQRKSDKELCGSATSQIDGKRAWNSSEANLVKLSVAEAHSRGLTIESCVNLVDGKTVSGQIEQKAAPKSQGNISAGGAETRVMAVCRNATTLDGQKLVWSNSVLSDVKESRLEAQQLGLTLQDCAKLLL